ncbi:MAG TPA: ABC transporter substrate-binding protein [Flavobacteriaceae bacterium]|jgi:raffinose/stachyose/melibiose transport system substrate-binding protein|nr:ABC transporter substrate-binding protein [Flavobacteriaceae bacterium]
MKTFLKLFFSIFILASFSTAKADTIKWLHLFGDDDNSMPGMLKAVKEFEEKTGHTVVMQYLENESFKAKLPTMLQSNDRPDIFYSWSGGVMYDQAKAGFLRDISGVVPDSYLQTVSAAAADAFTYGDQRVGLPKQVAQVAWWYNKDLINQAGVDVSKIKMWDDLLSAVQQVKDAGITPICMGGKDKWPVHFIWTHLHIRNGGKALFIDSLNNGGWGRPEYILSGEQMLELVALEPFQKGWLAATWPDQAGFFGDGKCAMAFMGNWMYGAQAANSASGEGLGDDNMGMFNMPMTKGGLGDSGDTLGGINGWLFSSSAPDSAVELIMHYVSKEIQTEDASNGAYIPIVKGADAALENPFLQQVAKNIANSQYHQIFYDQFLGADIGRVVNDVSTDLAAGIISAEEATQAVQEAWEFNQ